MGQKQRGNAMKAVVQRSVESERGQAFILVLIALLVGSILLTPLLVHMATGLKAGTQNETRMKELYAADAGIEYGMKLVQLKDVNLPTVTGGWHDYPFSGTVNGKAVGDVRITLKDDGVDPQLTGVYRIQSTAGGAAGTTITADVRILTFDDLGERAITSQGNISLSPGVDVDGKVNLNGTWNQNGGTVDPGQPTTTPIVGWPTADQMKAWYWEDVKSLANYAPNSINLRVSDLNVLTPMRHTGNLTIDNLAPNTLQTEDISGTMYIDGDLTFANPAVPRAYKIRLNGNTVFATGSLSVAGSAISFLGPGAIIAIGDVNFAPTIDNGGGANPYIFVMSVTGTVNFSPNGTYTGSVAGANVNFQPGIDLDWKDPTPYVINMPGKGGHHTVSEIITWEVNLN
jgi:hypothetical protein